MPPPLRAVGADRAANGGLISDVGGSAPSAAARRDRHTPPDRDRGRSVAADPDPVEPPQQLGTHRSVGVVNGRAKR